MPYLRLPNGRRVSVDGDKFIIGSDKGCDLRLNDASVALRHLILQRYGERWRAATLNLRAPITVNGQVLEGIRELEDGDVITLGQSSLSWQEQPEPSPAWTRIAMAAVMIIAVIGVSMVVWVALRDGIRPVEQEGMTVQLAVDETTSPDAMGQSAPPTATALPPTPTALPALAGNDPPERRECHPPAGWSWILISGGQSLWAVSQMYQIDLDVLLEVNCLTTETAAAGRRIYVPPLYQRPEDEQTGAENDVLVLVTTEPVTDTASQIMTSSDDSSPTDALFDPGEEGSEIVVTDFIVITPLASPSEDDNQSETAQVADTELAEPKPTIKICQPPEGWRWIIVGASDTWQIVADAYEIEMEALKEANCATTELLPVGKRLFVPPMSD